MKLKNSFIIICALFVFSASAYTQTTEIVKSKNKVMIQGKVYYVHIVKAEETLFSISKAYQVSQKEIAKENPDILWGLQVGQALKIPFSKSEQKETETEYIYHIVNSSETAFSLSKKYNISLEQLYEHNPGTEEGIYVSQVLRIPKKSEIKEKPVFDQQNDLYYYHQIKPEETFYSISRLYNIKVRRLKKANKNINVNELPIGQYMRIPKEFADADTIQSIILKEEEDSYAGVELTQIKTPDYSEPDVECLKENLLKKTTYNVALLLPFLAEKSAKPELFLPDSVLHNDSLTELALKQHEDFLSNIDWDNYVYPASINFIEFYQGVLMALKKLKTEGVSVNLYVYDTERSAEKAVKIIHQPEFENIDFIIGPIYPEALQVISNYSMEYRINMVSPLAQTNFLLENNPYLFQINPSYNIQIDDYAKKISNFYDQNLIMIHPGDSLNNSMINKLKEKLFAYISFHAPIDEVSFKELVYNKNVFHNDSINSFEQGLDKKRKNIVIVPSNNEGFVSEVLANMNTLSQFDYNIEVFGYSKWAKFDKIDRNYFYDLGVNLFSPYYVEYSDSLNINFVKTYRKSFGSEPYQFAFQGFDVAYYFISALNKYGVDFQFCLKHHKVDLIQSDYKFVRKNRYSGYENKHVFILKYLPGFQVKNVNN